MLSFFAKITRPIMKHKPLIVYYGGKFYDDISNIYEREYYIISIIVSFSYSIWYINT